MSVLKILNFTADSSLLNKFKNQQSAQQIAQEAAQQTASQIQQTNPLPQTSQPEQQEQKPENKNNHIKRIGIGVGAALALITLGISGRRGYLGKGIQKFLGGAEKKSKNITDDVITHSETRSSKPGSSNIPEAELVKFRNSLTEQFRILRSRCE